LLHFRVPRLELATIIGDNPTDQKPDEPIDNEKSVFTPSSKSTVSWGTPVSNPYILNKKDIEFGGTVYRPCSHLKHRPNSRWQQRNVCVFYMYLTYNIDVNKPC